MHCLKKKETKLLIEALDELYNDSKEEKTDAPIFSMDDMIIDRLKSISINFDEFMLRLRINDNSIKNRTFCKLAKEYLKDANISSAFIIHMLNTSCITMKFIGVDKCGDTHVYKASSLNIKIIGEWDCIAGCNIIVCGELDYNSCDDSIHSIKEWKYAVLVTENDLDVVLAVSELYSAGIREEYLSSVDITFYIE
jgi:hypothetical protein